MTSSNLHNSTTDKKKIETWIILPVKPLEQAKSRLSNILEPPSRRNLALHLFQNTLHILNQLQTRISNIKILVVTSDHFLLSLNNRYNFNTFLDTVFDNVVDDNTRLNSALSKAAIYSAAQSNEVRLLILPTDLPFLQLEDLVILFEIASRQIDDKVVLISPDRVGKGTNALFIQPANLFGFNFSYGPSSFEVHLEMAKKAGVKQPVVLNEPGLLYDLDNANDFFNIPIELRQNLLAPMDDALF